MLNWEHFSGFSALPLTLVSPLTLTQGTDSFVAAAKLAKFVLNVVAKSAGCRREIYYIYLPALQRPFNYDVRLSVVSSELHSTEDFVVFDALTC